MTKEIAIHNLFALKLRSRVTSDREALDMAIKALEQQKVGKWTSVKANISDDGFVRAFECSECKYITVVDDFEFCPNCGADMRESEEEK